MFIVHAQQIQAQVTLPDAVLQEKGPIVLAGTGDAIRSVKLPETADGAEIRVARLEYLRQETAAFDILADCAAHFRAGLARVHHGLRYACAESLDADLPEGAPVAWTADDRGRVRLFALSPLVAGSPLLAPLTRDLAAARISEETRFQYLAAAFAGA